MNGTARATEYGYSLWEFAGPHRQRHQPSSTPPTSTGPTGRRPAADLGPNVNVFDPSHAGATSRPRLDQIFARRRPTSSAPSATRCCSSRAPTTLNANIGFYTSVAGLGHNPDDVTINGDVTVDAGWFERQRHPELLALGREPAPSTRSAAPTAGRSSQAAPFRRMHVRGDLNLAPGELRLGQRRLHRRHARSTARSARTRSSSGTPATASSAAGPTACGTWSSPASRAPRRTSFPNPPYTTLGHHPGLAREAVPVPRRRRQLPGLRARRCGPTPPAPPGPAARTPGTLAAAEPVLRRQARRHRRDHQPGARPGPATCSSPRASTTSTRRINVTRAEHRRPRPRLRDDHPGQRRHRDARSPTSTASSSPACSSTPAPSTRRPCSRSARPARRRDHAANPTIDPGRVLPHRRRRSPARPPTAWSSTATTRSSTTSGSGAPTTATRRRLDRQHAPTPA